MFSIKDEKVKNLKTYLENKGNMKFKSHKNGNGFFLKGEVRDIIVHEQKLIVARNSDSLAIFKY